MSSVPDNQNDLSQLKQALTALRQARQRLDAIEQSRREPIAIIGMACRFPGGANSPEAFWHLLESGADAISSIPIERWNIEELYDPDPQAPGKMNSRWGGFIEDVDQFDPYFFGISPREASQMDPQQRLLLEVAWEAIEDAGLTKSELAGSQTGVYVGVHSQSNDYALLQYADPAEIDTYTGTGTAHNILPGRLAYLLDLQGPNIAVDTACSSSLVAVHLACQSLRTGESQLALAAGVNLILSPMFTISASKMHMLAPDGRCKTFDAAADGFVRGEGCGMIVLKRLSDAIADHDNILALIRGSAINQDGHTNGLTAPSSLSQQQVIKQAFENSHVEPSQIGYIETHGTGTVLGDPIEIEALAGIFRTSDQSSQLCYLGSAKSNIGHLEGAAGIAGLIKTILTLQKKAIPPVVHFKSLNPHISLENTPLHVPTELIPWPAGNARFAGVSSFGWSGTNAHIVLEEAPSSLSVLQPTNVPIDQHNYLLPLSAQSRESLLSLAQDFKIFLSAERTDGNASIVLPGLQDICYTASVHRTHHEHRMALTGSSIQEISESLDAFLREGNHPNVSVGNHNPDLRPRLAFVFPGQGSQWFGMARELIAQEPLFLDVLTQCDEIFRQYCNWSLLDQLKTDESSSRLNEIDVIQPVLFAIQVALAAMWRSWGIEPDAVIGHSMGEIAAAYVAGAINLKDSARIICLRSQLLRKVSGQGVMAVVGLPLDQAEETVKDYRDKVSIAVSNSPRSTVLSGDPTVMDKILEELRARNIFCRLVKVDVASHSPQMDPLKGDLLNLLVGLQPQAGSLPIYSTVTGEVMDGSTFDAEYWANNLRQPVSFSKMVQQLSADGFTIFLELSPHPILLSSIEETTQSIGQTASTISSLEREKPEWMSMLSSLGKFYTLGYSLNWSRFHPTDRQPIHLPKYPWQHQRYWLETANGNADATQLGVAKRERYVEDHPLLGRRLPDLAHLPGSYFWEKKIDSHFNDYLHDVLGEETSWPQDRIVRQIALTAAASVFGPKTHTIKELEVQGSLLFNGSIDTTLQIILTIENEDIGSFQLFRKNKDTAAAWELSARGKLSLGLASRDWLYRFSWELQLRDASPLQKPSTRGYWLIFGDQNGLGTVLKEHITERAEPCLIIHSGSVYQNSGNGTFTIDPNQPEDFQRLLNETSSSLKMPCHGIVFLWALDKQSREITGTTLMNSQKTNCGSVLNLLRALFHSPQPELPRLWLVTHGSQTVTPEPQATAPDIAGATLWGLGRVIAMEHPELWGGLVDLDPNAGQTQNAISLLSEIWQPIPEDQISFRGENRYVARLIRPNEMTNGRQRLRVRSDGTYLITGGLGGLGLKVAQWLTEQGARHLALMGRRGASSDASIKSTLLDMEQKGVQVVIIPGDVSKKEQVGAALLEIKQNMPPLRGILHAAGVLDDGVLLQQNWERFARVLSAKVEGTWNLHVLTQDMSLDLFVLFSSASSLLGLPGQGNYAAANSFLDAFTYYRLYQSLPCTSINWGMWAEVGLASQAHRNSSLTQGGLIAMSPVQGLSALEYLLQDGDPQSVVLPIDWAVYTDQLPSGTATTLLTGILSERNDFKNKQQHPAQGSDFLEKLHAASTQERPNLLATCISDQVKSIMHFDEEFFIDPQRGFFQLGMDSLMAVQLRNHLQRILDRSLPATLTFDYPTVSLLVEYFQDTLQLATIEAVPDTEAMAGEVDELEAKMAQISRDELKTLLDDEFEAAEKGL